tara:strand:- start:101 stop:307 length:207 start_codon:yes stop_codon:yes gene_type:complete
MYDPTSRRSGGAMAYYESPAAFEDMVNRVLELGMSDIGLNYPTLPEQETTFQRIAAETIPKMKAQFGQ